MLAITQIGFMVLLSGYNPKLNATEIKEIPRPIFYTQDDVDKKLKIIEAQTEIRVEHSVTYINEKEYTCLVKNIFFEARNQSNAGKQAIAVVTLERVKNKRFPKTICGVVQEERKIGRCQFSWYCDGISDNPNLSSKNELIAWNETREIATNALLGKLDIDLKGATHFHSTSVNPNWGFERIIKIDDHIFYKES